MIRKKHELHRFALVGTDIDIGSAKACRSLVMFALNSPMDKENERVRVFFSLAV